MSQLLTRSLTFRADSVDDAHRSVKAVVATENPVDVYDSLTGRVVSEVLLLGGMTAAAHVPLLLDHYRRITQTIGSVGDLRRDGNNLEARLSFAAGTQAADEAWLLVSQRHAASLGRLPRHRGRGHSGWPKQDRRQPDIHCNYPTSSHCHALATARGFSCPRRRR